ncbi:MAG: 2-phospho-L-lactate transferase [Acidobacteria bacterium]|nr:2-phospho-L-lactate transferase [Acidobacteriota bacterium]
MKITALAGGVGASKLLAGLQRALPCNELEDLTIIVNTGDDIKMFGLYIAPDIDIVTYTLAGVVNEQTGWGVSGDTFGCLERLVSYEGGERWFNLGDRDLATHIYRTARLGAGDTLSAVSDHLRRHFGLPMRILPMTDLHTPTTILTAEGPLHFQEYLIRRRAEPRVEGVRFEQIESALPAPGVIEAIRTADAIIICPSNPLISVGPILAVPGVRDAILETGATVLAVSPIVGRASLKGPTDRMLRDLGMEVSATQVATIYQSLIDRFLIDEADSGEVDTIRSLGIDTRLAPTVMRTVADKVALAQIVRDWLAE